MLTPVRCKMKHSTHILVLIFSIFSLLSIVLADEDYYKILGISRDANDKEIRNAYRQLSKKFHPDKNQGDDEAQLKFMEISNAYDILMDEEKRKIYDMYGEDGLKGGAGAGPGRGQRRGGDDPFANFFGGGHRQEPPRAQDANSELQFGLKDFYNGKDIDFQIQLMDNCPICKATGSSDGLKHNCNQCGGRGRIAQRLNLGHGMIQQIETTCPKCQGSGKEIKNKCKTCHGQGAYQQKKTFNIHLSPGTPKNYVEKFEGKGPAQPGLAPGSLNVIIKENKMDNLGYRRIGNNLYRTEALSLKEALNGGWSRNIPFFDNYEPTIKISRGANVPVRSGEVEVIKGKGMPLFSGNDEFGDLFIDYVVIFPLGNEKVLKKLHDEL